MRRRSLAPDRTLFTWLVFFCAGAAAAHANGTPAAPTGLTPEVDAYLTKALADWQIPGMAVAVVRPDRVVFAKGYGVRELGKPEPVDEHTVFDAASLTKSFTGTLAAVLVEEGKLAWDDPVRKHLPALRFPDSYLDEHVTVRDLLAHRTGLHPANMMWVLTDVDRAEVLRRARCLPATAGFRAGMVYSNVGYSIAGEALAAAGGASLGGAGPRAAARAARPARDDGELRGGRAAGEPGDLAHADRRRPAADPARDPAPHDRRGRRRAVERSRPRALAAPALERRRARRQAPGRRGGAARDPVAAGDHRDDAGDARGAAGGVLRRLRPGLAGHGLPRPAAALAHRQRQRPARLRRAPAQGRPRRRRPGQHLGRAVRPRRAGQLPPRRLHGRDAARLERRRAGAGARHPRRGAQAARGD